MIVGRRHCTVLRADSREDMVRWGRSDSASQYHGGVCPLLNLSWPAHLVDESAVRGWIHAVLPGHPRVLHPTILHQKAWGLTARFALLPDAATIDPHDGVIFKASLLPLFAAAPHIYAILSRHCPDQTPRHLASVAHGAQTWSLFGPLPGDAVGAKSDLGVAAAMARTLGEIQAAIALLPAAEMALLPRQPLHTLPALFDTVRGEIETELLPIWRGKGDVFDCGELPRDVLDRLIAYRPQVQQWTAALLAGRWPETLDHVDLHTDNAMVLPNGQVMILDWEEAVLSLPFFSLDRLLDDVRAGRLLPAGSEAREGSGKAQICSAYLTALPWGTEIGKEHAFDLAMRLAPIKAAYEGIVFAEARGIAPLARMTAQCMAKALSRWESSSSQ